MDERDHWNENKIQGNFKIIPKGCVGDIVL